MNQAQKLGLRMLFHATLSACLVGAFVTQLQYETPTYLWLRALAWAVFAAVSIDHTLNLWFELGNYSSSTEDEDP